MSRCHLMMTEDARVGHAVKELPSDSSLTARPLGRGLIMRRQRQEPHSNNNGSINYQVTDHTLFLLPSCSTIGVHF